MTRVTISACLVALALAAAPVYAQADVAGEWAVSFVTPLGPSEFTMVISQNGAKLTGHLTSDIGEFPLTGTVDGDQVKILWTLHDQGKTLEITFAGKVTGNSITGTATLGNVGQGPLSAERIST
jgi:D-glucosaminate-6-phosphate ammonia-lyase